MFFFLSYVAIRRNPPARNPREGLMQYIKKGRKKEKERKNHYMNISVLIKLCYISVILIYFIDFIHKFHIQIINCV